MVIPSRRRDDFGNSDHHFEHHQIDGFGLLASPTTSGLPDLPPFFHHSVKLLHIDERIDGVDIGSVYTDQGLHICLPQLAERVAIRYVWSVVNADSCVINRLRLRISL